MTISKPLKILLVADVEPGPDSGAAGTEYQTVEILRELGHNVDVIWKNDLSHIVMHGNLHYLLELPFSYWSAIKKRVAINDYDVIHINQPYSWYSAWRLRRQGFAGAVLNRSHGWEPNVAEVVERWERKLSINQRISLKSLLAIPMHWMLRNLYPKWSVVYADCTLVSSQEDRAYIRSRYQVGSKKVTLLPQAVNQAFLERPVRPMSDSRRTRILYVGQYTFVKAPNVVADVINDLAQKDATLSFTWCCDQSHHSAVLGLLNEAAAKRIALVSWMPQQDLITLYDSHGFFLFPSFYEGFGKAFLEAMSRGCVPVCSSTGGMKDIVQHHANGVLAPVGNVEAMVNGVEQLLLNHEHMDAISAQAGVDAAEYSWARFGQNLVQLYGSLV